LAVASVPLLKDHSPSLQGEGGRSKAGRLAELLGRPDAYGGMNVEFKLFVRLLVVERGRMSGTWEEIGRKMATDGRNVRSWAGKLRRGGKITVTDCGRKRVEIVLEEPYLGVAAAEDKIATMPAERPLVEEDPELAALIGTYRTAKATGSAMEVTTRRVYGNGKSQ
jgi:hypothetical protein